MMTSYERDNRNYELGRYEPMVSVTAASCTECASGLPIMHGAEGLRCCICELAATLETEPADWITPKAREAHIARCQGAVGKVGAM